MERYKRNVSILSWCQAVKLSQTSLIFAIVGLVGASIAGSPALATLPIALTLLVTVVVTIPARLLMARYGTKPTFIAASTLGAVGAAITAAAVAAKSFELMCLGMAIFGIFIGTSNFYRFVAADQSPTAFKSQAISYVLAGGVVASFVGPNLANMTRTWLDGPEFLGSFVSVFFLSLLTIGALVLLDLPTMSVEKQEGAARPMSAIARQPRFIVAIICGVFGFSTMTFLMLVAPLAMKGHHHAFSDTASVIQWHVFAMFAPAFFTGTLVKKFGAPAVMLTGAVLEVMCVVINFFGHELVHYWVALFALGVGWNFLYIGATALLTQAYRPSERAKTQAINDFVVSISVAIASFSAGAVYAEWGWEVANLAVVPGLVLIFLSLAWLRLCSARAHPKPLQG